MYLQAVRVPLDKHLVENSKQETKIEEILLRISSSNRYSETKCIPYHTTARLNNHNNDIRRGFEVKIKRCTQIIQQSREIRNAEIKTEPSPSENRKDSQRHHRTNGRRHKGISETASMVKSRNAISTVDTQQITYQNTNKVILTHSKRSRLIDSRSRIKNDRDLSSSTRPSTVSVLPAAKQDYEKATNFSPLYGNNNKETTAEERPFTVEERAKFDTQPESRRIPKLNRSLLDGKRSPVTSVVSRTIENPHSSERDCNGSDGLFGSKIVDQKADVVINLSEYVKDLRHGHNSCRYGRNMSSNKERKYKLSEADARWKNNTKSAPSKSSKRRPSSSPDEGIVHSVDEMEDNEPSYKTTQPEASKDDRTAITIEGGRIREQKVKRRSAKRERGSNKIKHNGGNEAITSESLGSDRTSRVSRNDKAKPSMSPPPKSTVLKVTKAEKAIARKVVRQALNDNSVARSYKPIWVKLPNHTATNHADQVRKGKTSGSTKKSTPNEQYGAKDVDTGRRTRSKPHRNGVVHSNSVKEVSKRLFNKATKSHADHRRVGKSETRNDDATKSSSKRKDPVRTNMRNKPNVKVSRQHRYRDVTEGTQETSLLPYSRHKRTVSADSSVRDLSYSSSSSQTTTSSSSISRSTSSSSESNSISSSSYSSRSYYSNASSNDGKIHQDEDAENSRQTRYKSGHGQSSNSRTNRPTLKLHEYWRKNVRSKIQDLEVKTETMELNSKMQAARDVEKPSIPYEDEEFEIDIGKKRNRRHKHDGAAEDAQKSLWQHHRLVMTSRQCAHPTTNRRPIDKWKPATETALTVKSKPTANEDGGKDGASTSIRDIYSLHNVLSDTQNGTVIAGHRRTDGMRVAIKRISKSGTTRWGWLNGRVVPLELALLCQVNEIRHAGVVEIIEWHETVESFLLVMARPHPSVDLYDHLTKHKRLDEATARRITRQLLTAILHCLKLGVLHRDVKLENILFNPLTKEAILIDFGCGDYSRPGSFKEFAGTPEYYPPEWYLHKKYNGDSATVWSIGVLVYSLLCGTLPFRSAKEILNKEPTKFPVHISHRARNFLRETLRKNGNERISMANIMNHPWLKFSKEYFETRKTSV